MRKVVEVAVFAGVDKRFDYEVPEDLETQIVPGSVVEVPLGPRRVAGVVWKRSDGDHGGRLLKSIHRVIPPAPALSRAVMEWLEWGADFYLAPLGEVLRAALPPFLIHPRRFESRGPRSPLPDYVHFHKPPPERLSAAQERALSQILLAIQNRSPDRRGLLLHGITGSGKTALYIAVAREVRSRGQGILCLVPEIGLTPQLAGAFRAVFGGALAIYHSGLSPAQRSKEWQRVAAGEAPIVLGTRSALFLPVKALGLIILDEEHDTSYKQSSGFRYEAKTLALERGRRTGAFCLLGSATPSFESLAMVQRGELESVVLDERPTGQALPTVEIVDMRRRGGKSRGAAWLSSELREAIEKTTGAGHQVLLFLNRKGFAPYLLCPSCGEPLRCPHCTVSLALHNKPHRLLCHYCEFSSEPATICPGCGGGPLHPLGVGTERIESEIRKTFPFLRVARLDRTVASRKGHMEEILRRLKKRELDILIGTQMVAKGHDYPGITLVGIISADTALRFPDFRAAERTYQLLVQVAGRAGRGAHPGRVLVQTYAPEHPAIRAALDPGPRPASNEATRIDSISARPPMALRLRRTQGTGVAGSLTYNSFVAQEIETRRALHYPPFSTLILLRAVGKQEKRVEEAARNLHAELAKTWGHDIPILGPAPAPICKLRGLTRWQILLKIPEGSRVREGLRAFLDRWRHDGLPFRVRLDVDVDPTDML